MRILNFGSMNIDKVYTMPHIVLPEETASSLALNYFAGGKGLNQSVALARAKAPVFHAGRVGFDGDMLLNIMRESGVDIAHVRKSDGIDSGHAIIQVDSSGQNSIILYGGANRTIDKPLVDSVLKDFEAGDYLLLQNEISCLGYLVEKANEKGMIIALNPAPMNENILAIDLTKINWLILNEIEGAGITGKTTPEDICDTLLHRFPECKIILTLGSSGSIFADKSTRISQGIFDIPVVDTTAAGDTFIGYFLSAIMESQPVEYALKLATMASAIAVSCKGAAPSIPERHEVVQRLQKLADATK